MAHWSGVPTQPKTAAEHFSRKSRNLYTSRCSVQILKHLYVNLSPLAYLMNVPSGPSLWLTIFS